MAANYSTLDRPNQPSNSPYGSGDPYYSQSTGYITPQAAPKKGLSKWIKFGVPLLVVAIVAAVVGGVLGSRKSSSSSAASSSGGGSGSGDGATTADPSAVATAKSDASRYATATNAYYQMPLYPSTVCDIH